MAFDSPGRPPMSCRLLLKECQVLDTSGLAGFRMLFFFRVVVLLFLSNRSMKANLNGHSSRYLFHARTKVLSNFIECIKKEDTNTYRNI